MGGCVPVWGVYLPGGVCTSPGGVPTLGGVPAQEGALRHTPL